MYPITTAAVVALMPLYILLAARVILYRRQNKISLGDGGDIVLARRVRAHANFAEYVPLALFVLFLNEAQQVNAIMLYVVVAFLVLGRYSHAYALSSFTPQMFFRVGGMAGTFTAIILGTVMLATTLL
jgi:uncharacterized membrane protein YecN with MAPEG domain